MRRIAIAFLLSCSVTFTGMAQAPTNQSPTNKAASVGTYDRLSIVIAYYNSPQWKATLEEKRQEKDAATKANDTAKLAQLDAWGQTQQDLAIRQMAGKAPLDNILQTLEPAFKLIEGKLKLSSIVVSPPPRGSGPAVDVTPELLDWLHVDAQTRQWIAGAHPQTKGK